MTTEEADELLAKIEDMAREIEEDKELEELDPRYGIVAMWIDTDINSVNP
jgi:predicted house-cleaning noncanonical NTP pyrophosphatase (MazG superfamily)